MNKVNHNGIISNVYAVNMAPKKVLVLKHEKESNCNFRENTTIKKNNNNILFILPHLNNMRVRLVSKQIQQTQKRDQTKAPLHSTTMLTY